MWLAVPQQAPRGLHKGRDAGEAGAPLYGLASTRVVSEKTRETQETGGDLVGHYYVVGSCPLIIAGHSRGPAPKQGS